MTSPTIGVLENAASATFWSPSLATAFGLSQMKNAAGVPLEIQTASGCTATAFSDGAGHVIVAFQGTTTAQQSLADAELMSTTGGAAMPAFKDALAFTKSVQQVAAANGIAAANVFVTGHSLGGTLAEYVASQTGLGGASFAGSGVPGLSGGHAGAGNFVSFVEHGDAFANWSTDGSEHVLISPGVNEAHYGQLVFLGSSANDAMTSRIVSDDQALAPSLFTGGLSQAMAKLSNDFTTSLLTIHAMPVYQGDISSPSFAGSAADQSGSALHSYLYASG